MNEALQAQEIMLATLSGALVVLFGALYAMLFAFAKLRHPLLMPLAYAAYALFAAAALMLAKALHMEGYWLVIILVMLVGYLLAPHGIWHLCIGTHVNSGHEFEGENHD